MSHDSISVLIRTFNSAKTLGDVISRLDLLPEDEVIIVDSGSTDQTLDLAQKAGAKIVRAEGPFNYSRSLNLGFQAAKNPWVHVISSHHLPGPPDSLAIFRKEAAVLPDDIPVIYAPSSFCGEKTPGLPEDRAAYVGKELGSTFCGNANTLYRRSAWQELPFDETIETAEDRVWFFQMMERNRRAAYLPMAWGYNLNNGSCRYMFHKGHRDAKNMRRTEGTAPMRVRHLLGASKRIVLLFFRRKITLPVMNRRLAMTLGSFFGSRAGSDA